MKQEIAKRMKITLDELLSAGIISIGQKLRIYNADHPMGRDGTHYLLKEYKQCIPPQRYKYKTDGRGNVVYIYETDENGNKIPILNSAGNQAYEEVDGKRVPRYRKTPVVIGEREEWKEYCTFKDCYVSHIYCEEFYDVYGRVKDTGIAIQIFGGNR